MRGDAVFSVNKLFRYRLDRFWNDERPGKCCFIMLNPSTADAVITDPTISRCVNFAKSWGYGALSIVNLFAYRTPYTRILETVKGDIVGPDNNMYISQEVNHDKCGLIVAGWGNTGGNYPERIKEVMALITDKNVMCFGLTKLEQPIHPLYVPRDATLTYYRRSSIFRGNTHGED